MKALNHSGIDSSLVFGINNLAIVSFSLILGFAIFKEKLSRLNWVGVAASILCIILLIEY
jgi:EamA domain-containing membrane protein RarD